MARYIDADILTALIQEKANENQELKGTAGYFALETFKEILKIMPTADVVEVVRCKDCCFSAKHPTSDVWKICTNGQWNTEYYPLVCDNDFCSYGERK